MQLHLLFLRKQWENRLNDDEFHFLVKRRIVSNSTSDQNELGNELLVCFASRKNNRLTALSRFEVNSYKDYERDVLARTYDVPDLTHNPDAIFNLDKFHHVDNNDARAYIEEALFRLEKHENSKK